MARAQSGGLRMGSWGAGLSERASVLMLLAAHVVVWTIFCSVTHGTLHHDITEAWTWGKEFALGYPKHPPAYAWIAAAWFSVFPRADWAFYLLAELNGALGLLGAWAIAGRLLPDQSRTAALALLALTPLYNLYALKYNANTALLALWPWTAYLLIRSLETRSLLHGALFGLLAAVSVLTKYYSALLLASCFGAALLHPGARAYFRSASPYVAVAVGALAIAPHVWWMFTHDFQTIEYAMATTKHPTLDILGRGLAAVGQAIAMLSVAAGFYLWMLAPEERRSLPSRLVAGALKPVNWWVALLAFGPFVLTFVALLVGHVRISAQFMIPIFFMVPAAVIYLAQEHIDGARLRFLARPAIAFPLLALLAAPVVSIATFKGGADTWSMPRRAVSEDANRIWREVIGSRLDVVAGDDRYSQALTFYGPDAPSDFIEFDMRKAPWITQQRLAQSGLLVVCRKGDDGCGQAAKPFLTPGTQVREITHTPSLWGLTGKPRTLVLYLIPPMKQ